MTRRHREGDWFAIPLGDGRYAAGLLTHRAGRVVGAACFGPACVPPPAVAALAHCRPEAAAWTGRLFDAALADQRWALLGRYPGFVRCDWPIPPGGAIVEPGFVESVLAARLAGRAHARVERCVRDLCSPLERHALDELPDEACLQWRRPLAPGDIAIVERRVAQRPTRLRLYGAAAAQAGAFAGFDHLLSLALESQRLPPALPRFPHVRELALDGMPREPAALLRAFPALASLEVRARCAAVDARDLRRLQGLQSFGLQGAALAFAGALGDLPALRALDLRDVRVDDADALLRLPLRALRLARVTPVVSIAALAGNAGLRTLAIDGLTSVDDVRPIVALEALESLDLVGLWQLELPGLDFLAGMARLCRLRVDIGGRRKNAEIYRRRSLAEPLPFGPAGWADSPAPATR